MDNKIPEIKKDKYFDNRNGYSQIYSLHCNKCEELLTYYQKDGAGKIKRIYVDRISNSDIVKNFSIDHKLICPQCQGILGLGYIYQKEQRPAYKLFEGEVKKAPIDFWRNIKFMLFLLLKK